MTRQYGWASVVALSIVGLAAALSLSIALPIGLQFVLTSLGEARGLLLQPIVSLASALLAFAGVGISGLVGLQVLRRDRAENNNLEARAIAAALSGECEDLAGMFRARSDHIQLQIGEERLGIAHHESRRKLSVANSDLRGRVAQNWIAWSGASEVNCRELRAGLGMEELQGKIDGTSSLGSGDASTGSARATFHETSTGLGPICWLACVKAH